MDQGYLEVYCDQESKSRRRVWPDWYPELARFRSPNAWRAGWQLTNTLVPYGILWYLMILTIHEAYSYALTLFLALVAAAFMVRAFVLFHDCVHDSFFASKKANAFCGHLLGILTFTPFDDWRFSHLRHHATYANLDTRGFGDIWTLTLMEYQNSPRKIQMMYRLYRNPVILLGLGAIFIFLLRNRLPTRTVSRKERMSVLFTNLLIIIVALLTAHIIGWKTYLLIQIPILWFAGMAGIWLFYVQHQFPGGYWARKSAWEPLRAAMEGSSFYKLPQPLRWFSANIGYHHVHHLGPRIPNYRLKKCYDAVPALHEVKQLTIAKSFSCVRLKTWDEKLQKMVSSSQSSD